ncbi:MAG: hypothetical protein RJA99_3556 [Pseudomonadota bacterium]|jgi:hypothetical protein
MRTSTTSPAAARLRRDDVLMRVQRRIGLASADGLGVVRRAIFWGLFGWLPVAVWAIAGGHARGLDEGSLLSHFGVTVRLLVAVPLLIVAEAAFAGALLRVAPQCAEAGLFHGDPVALGATAGGLIRLRDRTHPWVIAAGLAAGWAIARIETVGDAAALHDLAWAGADAASGFGARWYLWVARPMFVAFALAWLWRVVLLGVAIRRLAATGLNVVPTHPDRCGGLGFVDGLAGGFGLVAFALSAVIASGWAHEVAVHGGSVTALAVPMAAAVVWLVGIFVAPFLVLVPTMVRAKSAARLRYGALVARHGDALHRRWIGGEVVDDPLLDAPEVGAAADAAMLYESVVRMRLVPIGAPALGALAVPAALPMLAVAAMQVPVVELLKTLLRALV